METWKDVVGYEGLYKVSSLGSILLPNREWATGRNGCIKRHNPERLSKQSKKHSGYLCVSLRKSIEQIQIETHRLVATAFIPNPENKPCVNHINGIKTDNRVENLEWCTYSENNKHAFSIGLRNQDGQKNPFARKCIIMVNGKKMKFNSLVQAYTELGISKHRLYHLSKVARIDDGQRVIYL